MIYRNGFQSSLCVSRNKQVQPFNHIDGLSHESEIRISISEGKFGKVYVGVHNT